MFRVPTVFLMPMSKSYNPLYLPRKVMNGLGLLGFAIENEVLGSRFGQLKVNNLSNRWTLFISKIRLEYPFHCCLPGIR